MKMTHAFFDHRDTDESVYERLAIQSVAVSAQGLNASHVRLALTMELGARVASAMDMEDMYPDLVWDVMRAANRSETPVRATDPIRTLPVWASPPETR